MGSGLWALGKCPQPRTLSPEQFLMNVKRILFVCTGNSDRVHEENLGP